MVLSELKHLKLQLKLLDYCSRLYTRMHRVIKAIKTVFCLADTCLLVYAVR